jgi:predicted AAA+ superfamily ATPase
MAQSNHERVGRALELLNSGLTPFVEREMQAKYGSRWHYEAATSLREQHLTEREEGIHLDTQALLLLMWDQWTPVFSKVLGHAERSLVSELRTTRNQWAHQEAFSTDDAYRALDSMQRLLTAISASAQANELERQKYELMRQRFEEQARHESRKGSTAPLEGRPLGGLRPWREVVTPHPDVAKGNYQQAEFAADLAQVHQGVGSDEYRVPRDFFQRTYLTYGLRKLLVTALQRLSGTGGDPVVDLQTNFGGGKTHSLLALYHLFSGVPVSDLVGMEPVLSEAGVPRPPQTRRAVLVGYALSPGQATRKPDGCLVQTLWGELAWQLLGQEGYALVAEADRQGVSPGSEVLRELFVKAAPCLILIDEWVVFARQLYGVSGLPAGSFDANLSFAQSLTEAAKAAPRTLVVASLPASDTEVGGEGGREAMIRLKNIFGRVESPWRPAEAEEGYEIVRRRLFQPITDPALFVARDAVAKAFVEAYRSQPQAFPAECRESSYEQRIKACYPIHPELFDRLYKDWSTIDQFQRTRGVLRLMAAVVHTLWEQQDSSLLILPATVPINVNSVQFELTRHLENSWLPVIEKDVDGPHSLPLHLDQENSALGRYSACRRVARTIFLGSAPIPQHPNKGLTEERIQLGSVQPGESIATFGDALRRLSDQATHLYLNGQRYWYATQPSVTRLAQDRATQIDEEEVYEVIKQRLHSEQKTPGDFGRVHPCPATTGDVADEDSTVRLVLLRPQVTHALRDQQSSARDEARRMLDLRGPTRRTYRNTLLFLAADRTRLEDLKQGVRQFLAWDSICQESETLNLDSFQRNQAQSKREEARKSVEARIPETYIWLLVPDQPDPRKPDELQELKLQPQPQASLAQNASRRLKMEEMLMTQLAGTRLRHELDRIPLWKGNHIGIKELADYFARYVYLPRLKNTEVLLNAIRDGVASPEWARETFAYAESWDTEQNRYLGLKAGQAITVSINASNVLVKPEAALAQRQADEASRQAQAMAQTAQTMSSTMTSGESQIRGGTVVVERGGASLLQPATGTTNPVELPVARPLFSMPTAQEDASLPHRFYGSVQIDPRRMASDAGKIMEEVVKHLTSLPHATVSITLEIQALLPDGVPAEVVRTVSENCRTLRFESHGFEEE